MPSMCPDEALHFVDAVVIGEAESVWGQVLTDAASGQLQERYQGAWLDAKASARGTPRYLLGRLLVRLDSNGARVPTWLQFLLRHGL